MPRWRKQAAYPRTRAVSPATAESRISSGNGGITQALHRTADSRAMTTQVTHQMFACAAGGIVVFAVVARLLIRG